MFLAPCGFLRIPWLDGLLRGFLLGSSLVWLLGFLSQMVFEDGSGLKFLLLSGFHHAEHMHTFLGIHIASTTRTIEAAIIRYNLSSICQVPLILKIKSPAAVFVSLWFSPLVYNIIAESGLLLAWPLQI